MTMSVCPLCGKQIHESRYSAPAEVYGREGLRLAHIECCSINDLKKLLTVRARSEIEFFDDASKLVQNPSLSSINEFEKKYGDYYELAQSNKDDEIAVVAIIAELKKRLTKSK